MAKSRETFNKKDKEKKRLKNLQDKREKMEERKANAQKGKRLEDMMAYIDENGNISDTPTDPRFKRTFNQADIPLGVPIREKEEAGPKKGVVNFFDDKKGFGFINDAQTGQRVFVHANNLSSPIKEGDQVNFETEKSPRGPVAINVTKI